MGNIEHWASIGAAALVKNGVVVDHVTGDVLYDYDFTPIEVARVVLEAVNPQGAVAAERERIAALVRRRGIKRGGDALLTELADHIVAGGQ